MSAMFVAYCTGKWVWQLSIKFVSFMRLLTFETTLSFIKGLFWKCKYCIMMVWFCCFTSQVNSYGNGGTVSSLNLTFPGQAWTSSLPVLRAHTFACNWQQPFLNHSRREGNDHRNYFMINLLQSMGLGWDQTRDPWICSQTGICCQTLYRLRYAAR